MFVDQLRRQGEARAISFLALVRAMRPHQWTKNAIVFAALVFDRHLFETETLIRSIGAAICFCLISSAVYLVNDIRDIQHDRQHPRKRFRPIAAGHLSVWHATLAAAWLSAVSLALAWIIAPTLALVMVAYVSVMIGYSFGLKRMVIVDVCMIAGGFVLRAVGGAVAISVPASPWLYVCTALLALFIGFGKRRAELSILEHNAAAHRPNLDEYSIPLLDQLISIVSSATVIAYAFYTFGAPSVPDNHAMMLTVPFVVYAIFRYLYLIYQGHQSDTPERLLFRDLPLLVSIVGWGLASIVIMYPVG